MKQIFRIISIATIVFCFSGCGEMLNFVSNSMTFWEQSEQATPEQKALANIWNEGGTRGKILIGTAAVTDVLGAFGVNTQELNKIQQDTQNALANSKPTGNELVDLGVTLSYYGAAIVDNRIAKKKGQEFDEYVQEHRDLRTNPENTAYYDEYYDYRYEIDYEARTIKKRDFGEFMDLLRSKEAAEEVAKKKEELIAWGILGEWEYEELFGTSKLREQNADLYRKYISKLIFVPGTYNLESEVYKTDTQAYITINDAQNVANVSDSENSMVADGQCVSDFNDTGLSTDNVEVEQSLHLADQANALKLAENLEQINVRHYSFNTIDLSSTQKKELDELVELMEGNDFSVCITGHTCNIGSEKANYNVGYKRAEEAKKYLINKGISEERIVLTSAGASLPVASNETVGGRSENRRITFAVQQ